MKIQVQHLYPVTRLAEFCWPKRWEFFFAYLCTEDGVELMPIEWLNMEYLPAENISLLVRHRLIVRLVLTGDIASINEQIELNWIKAGNRSRRHPRLTKWLTASCGEEARYWGGIQYPERERVGAAIRPADIRRAMRMELAPGRHTTQEWRQIMQRDGWKCLRCGSMKRLTKDHVVPIARGGSNDASNLQTLCHSCNSWKGAKHIDFRSSLMAGL